MSKRVCFYGECMTIPGVVVRDEITKEPKERDPDVKKKLDRVISLLEELAKEKRPAPADVMAAKKAQRRENARRLRERDAKAKKYETPEDRVTVPAKFLEDAIRQAYYEAACENSQAAYAARNPHKAQQDAPQDTRVQYPHKPRQRAPWEDRLATQDSASGFMIICEQVETAYAARNPHKKGVKDDT